MSLAIGVVNMVPVAGLGGPRSAADLLVYGLHAALDVAAALLALQALRAAPAFKNRLLSAAGHP
ncbi:hypothetical protein [Deinococcus multiflagellatus]|uniref:Uncharacterized protein n=1 Tax=Deinococcus multiflagellatus TaxID=1656887 RepID=A0ABW1ZNE2_9DEIO